MVRQIFVHIVSFNSAETLATTIQAALAQRVTDSSIVVAVTDNASADNSVAIAQAAGITVATNPCNLGFCAAHNQGVAQFLASNASHLLILNPDLALAPGALQAMVNANQPMVTPKLVRGDTSLSPVTPLLLDAAGMTLKTSLRHFDRGSNKPDEPQYKKAGFVFGGTGACLLLTRDAIHRLLLPRTSHEALLSQLHPHLADKVAERPQLFDEAFFAYREDADLAWRAQRYGLRCWYEPTAVGVHKRVVLPQARAKLSKELNRLGVRNRFLLQSNHFHAQGYSDAYLSGFILRNAVVLAGVIIAERSSMSAFRDLRILTPRRHAMRAILREHSVVPDRQVARWLHQEIE